MQGLARVVGEVVDVLIMAEVDTVADVVAVVVVVVVVVVVLLSSTCIVGFITVVFAMVTSHCAPSNPNGHRQMNSSGSSSSSSPEPRMGLKPPSRFSQTAPFWHGLLSHGYTKSVVVRGDVVLASLYGVFK